MSSHERTAADEDASLVTEMVQEMKRHRDVFLSMSHGKHELGEFWLRKTQKPVLAVLCVRRRKDTGDDDEKNTDEKEHEAAVLSRGQPGSLHAHRVLVQ